jgi:hypothetical protein
VVLLRIAQVQSQNVYQNFITPKLIIYQKFDFIAISGWFHPMESQKAVAVTVGENNNSSTGKEQTKGYQAFLYEDLVKDHNPRAECNRNVNLQAG